MSTRTLVTLFAIPLLALAACSREKSDWRTAQAADTPESYEQFISSHPDSALVASARERLAQMAEEKDWRTAAGLDTLESYQQFLAQYPAGKWAKEAQVRVDNFAAAPGIPGSTPPPSAAGRGASLPVPAQPDAAADSAVAPAAEPAAGTAEPPAFGATGFGVQLGAFSSADRANAEWTRLKVDAAGMLDGLEPRVVVGETAGKSIYRLQAEVRDEAQARAICGGLKVANKPCVPVLPPN
jgi:cell division septation protein DedD